MKNSIKLLSLILIAFCFNIKVIGQVQINPKNTSKNNNRIYVSPLNFGNVNGASAQITYGRVLDNNNEVQISYAQKLKYFEPKFTGHDDVRNSIEWMMSWLGKDHTRYAKGYKIGIEHQFVNFISTNDSKYLGFELFHEMDQIDFYKITFLHFKKNTDYSMKRSNIGLNIKRGRKYQLGERFVLDYYYGIGLKYVQYKYENYIDDNLVREFNNGDTRLKVNIPVNIKIAYSF